MVITELKPREYYSKNSLDCLPTCVRAILDTLNLGHYYYKILKNLSITKYGYNFIEVCTKLAENNLLTEVGLYDTDYIPRLNNGVMLNYEDLTNLLKKGRRMPRYAVSSLKEVSRFAQKYPDLIKIKKADFKVIEDWLTKGIPICMNVHLATLKKSDDPKDDVMHSFIIYGFNKTINEIYIWDPASQYRIVEWSPTVKAWHAAGGYYLVLKKN